MAEPWIRVHANLANKPVVDRAIEHLAVGAHEAMGLLVQFWGAVSQHVVGGIVGDFSDAQLERWAGWTRKRGCFAAFIRKFHLDADGRVNDWLEYAGVLELRREKERDKKRRQRGTDEGRPAPVPGEIPEDIVGDVPPLSVPDETRRNGTRRDATKRDAAAAAATATATAAPATAAGVLDGDSITPLTLAAWANRAITARYGEQRTPISPSTAIALAGELIALQVEPAIARQSIDQQVKKYCQIDVPHSVKYFGDGIKADWRKEQGSRRSAEGGVPKQREAASA